MDSSPRFMCILDQFVPQSVGVILAHLLWKSRDASFNQFHVILLTNKQMHITENNTSPAVAGRRNSSS